MTIFDIDPNVVKPGWTPFIITLALAAVMVVLYRSMRRQFGRIRNLPHDHPWQAEPRPGVPTAGGPSPEEPVDVTRASSGRDPGAESVR